MSEPLIVSMGVGHAVEKKAAGNKFLSVHLSGAFPLHEGEIKSTHETLKIKNVNHKGEEYEKTLQGNTTVTAEWKGGDNRFTSPCIEKGEQVDVTHIPGTDRFFWESIGRDNSLRRTETIVKGVAASGAPKEKNINLTNENTYVYGIDSANKMLYLNTSKDNGEKVAFKIFFDTGDGKWSVEDDLGNHIQCDSLTGHFLVENKDGSTFELNGKEASTEADVVKVKCKNFIVEAETTIFTGKVGVNESISTPEVSTIILSGTPVANYKKN